MIAGRGKFFWRLFLGNASLLVAVVGACVLLILGAFDRFYAQDLTDQLSKLADALRYQVKDRFDLADAEELERVAKAVGTSGADGVRITFVLTDGTVVGDSEADPADMENHADREEIRQALRQGRGTSTRWSRTVQREMSYVALRIGPPDVPGGVVRVSMGRRSIIARTHTARQLFLTIAVVVLVAAVVLALGLARMWSGPIGRITEAARSLSRGDLSARAPVTGSDEVALLARSLNQMRDDLAGQLDTIDHQRRTLELLLAQLHEGVVVAGPDGRVVLVNPAASRLFDQIRGPDSCHWEHGGLDVERVVPPGQLRDMFLPTPRETAAVAGGDSPAHAVQECRVTFDRPQGGVTVLARASDIVLPGQHSPERGANRDGDRPAPGRILVLTDVTELTRAVQVKTDFVMNASHELRTPLSAIRAAVETLLSMNVGIDRDGAMQIVRVIERHSARLEAMVADLLDLSRIESEAARFEPSELSLDDVFGDLKDRFRDRLYEKNLRWDTDVSVHGPVIVSPALLNLVLDNLVDNSIKFTASGGRIAVAAWSEGHAFGVRVVDTGCGIPEEARDRVFERFYQAERARTGTTRGTGLGLSIVRHAVRAMKGSVQLDSAVGEGTEITVIIPQPQASPLATAG
jgi:two-component system phosphate regulon sensor histidine kinase PhoR